MRDDTLRLFFALPCPPESAAAICAWRDALALGGRALAAEHLHLTLVFLGQQPRARLDELRRLAAGIEAAPFVLHLDRLDAGRHGLLWLAPSAPPAALERLAAQLRARLQAAGVDCDGRPLRPHLSLLRHAAARPAEARPDFAWPVEAFALYASLPTPRGVRYRELGRWPLRASLQPPRHAAPP